jgi:RND family efflux transporter MFP subunit
MSDEKRLLTAATLCLLGAALLSSGCRRSQAAAEEEIRPAPVKVAKARALAIGQWTELLGTTQPLPDHIARISAPFEGRIASVLKDEKGNPVHEGQAVKAGMVLAQLDIRLIQDNRDAAQAALRQLDEEKKQADIAAEQADLEIKRLQEMKQLDQKLVRPFDMSKAQLALQDAQSKQRGVVAKQEAGNASVKLLNDQIALSTLHSPIDGRLGMVQVVPGQSLAIGAAIAEVVDLSEVDVLCYVPPYISKQLKEGMPARVKSPAEGPSDYSGTGKIIYIALQASPETGNFAVKVRFPNPDLRLRANTVLAVEVQTQPEKERLTIQDTALMEDQDPPGVIVFQDLKVEKTKEGKEEKRGKARLLKAIVGVRDRSWRVVEILGLEDPETKESIPLKDALFVIEGHHGLETGDVVKVLEEED